MTDNKILDKLYKLKLKMESVRSIGNEEEAQLFAAKIQELLSKYKLEMGDVDFAQLDRTDPVKFQEIMPGEMLTAGIKPRQKRVTWAEIIADGVAYGHFCKFMVMQGTNVVCFIGRGSESQIAKHMFLILCATAEKLADEAYGVRWKECAELGNVTRARGFRKSWLLGFAVRIKKRYYDLRQMVHFEQASNETALLRLDNSGLAIEAWVKENLPNSRTIKRPAQTIKNSIGFNRGHEAGGKADLQQKALSTNPQKRLGS